MATWLDGFHTKRQRKGPAKVTGPHDFRFFEHDTKDGVRIVCTGEFLKGGQLTYKTNEQSCAACVALRSK